MRFYVLFFPRYSTRVPRVHHVYQQCCCPEGMNHEISFHLHTTLFTSASLFWAFNFIDFEIYAKVLTNLATL